MTLSRRLLAALVLCAAVTACTPPAREAAAPAVPRDTGNMAYPTPVPAGTVSTVRPQ